MTVTTKGWSVSKCFIYSVKCIKEGVDTHMVGVWMLSNEGYFRLLKHMYT